MKLLSYAQWLLKKAISIPVFIRYGLTLFFWLLIIGIWYLFAYYPLLISTTQNVSYQAMQEQLKQLEPLQKQMVDIDRAVIHKKKVLADLCNDQTLCEQRIEKFIDLLEKHNLTLLSYAPLKNIKNEWYTIFPMKIKIIATFKNLMELFESLAQHAFAMNVTSMDIQKVGEGLSVLLAIDFFWYSEDESNQKKIDEIDNEE